MPKPACVQCGSNDSLLWRNRETGQICNECHLSNVASKEAKAEARSEDEEAAGSPARATGRGTRKSTRATRYKPPPAAVTASSAQPSAGPPPARGRGRRALLKRAPLRAPTATATLVTSQSIFYKGAYMQVGDVVSVQDVEGGTYYAQIRGFLTDQYCEKSAVLTWLLPTKASPAPEESFDPATYIIGPEEALPRKLEYMSWVMHAPADYYRASCTPYPPQDAELHDSAGFIWTAMDPPPPPPRRV